MAVGSGLDSGCFTVPPFTGCRLAANTVFTTTVTLGCKAYQDAQARSCYCPSEEKYYSKYEKKSGTGKGREL